MFKVADVVVPKTEDLFADGSRYRANILPVSQPAALMC